jgi:transposase
MWWWRDSDGTVKKEQLIKGFKQRISRGFFPGYTLVRNKTNVSNQLHAYSHQGKPNKETIARSKKLISFLDRQIKQIEKDIKSFVDRDKELKTKMEYLLSIPGVGMVSATVIVAETNGFAAIESIKQLTSYGY